MNKITKMLSLLALSFLLFATPVFADYTTWLWTGQNGAELKNSTNNVVTLTENSEDIIYTFGSNAIVVTSSTGVTSLTYTGIALTLADVVLTGDITLKNGATIVNTSGILLTITEATVDVVGILTADSIASDGAVSGTTITASGLLTANGGIESTYGTDNAIAITVSEATNGIGAINITSTPTIDDGEYHVPIWVDAQLALTGGGSIYGVRGHVGTIAGITQDATGYQIGVHGRILNLGTVDNGGIIIAGLLGQTLTGGTYTAVSHMSCAWLDWQSTTTVTAGETELLYLSHNAAGFTLDQFIYIYGANATDYFIKFATTMTGGWSDTGTTEGEECVGHLKVRYNNADAYINVFSDNS